MGKDVREYLPEQEFSVKADELRIYPEGNLPEYAISLSEFVEFMKKTKKDLYFAAKRNSEYFFK